MSATPVTTGRASAPVVGAPAPVPARRRSAPSSVRRLRGLQLGAVALILAFGAFAITALALSLTAASHASQSLTQYYRLADAQVQALQVQQSANTWALTPTSAVRQQLDQRLGTLATTLADAAAYIERGPLASYAQHGFGLWLVTLKDGGTAIGMCGLIKREGLDDVDIGFAYLPQFCGRGYATEAAAATLASFTQDRPTLTLLVPAVMKALLDHPGWASADLSSLRAVWAGSSTLPQALVDAFHARGLPVCNVYGATETGPFSIALDERHALTHPGSCGWPAPGLQVRLGNPVDGVGELQVRGPNVVQHYWPQRPAVDAEGWFHSGDLARQAADGSYSVVGRAKDMIISGGENIYPAEIENALAAHPDVAECAVLGVADARWGEAVVAAVVPRPGCRLDTEALQGHLQQRVARYKLPRRYVTLDALPKTALGKVQKSLLLKAVQ